MALASVHTRSSVPPGAWAMLGRTDLEASTCWDFPTQADGHPRAGDASFNGVTPARCAGNLVRRYSRPGELVVDPMAGSGTIGEVGRVAAEARPVLVPGGILAWIIADEYRGGVYTPAGFRLLTVLSEAFEPIDTVVLVRHHDRSASPMWEHRARRFNFYLRGFK